MAQFRTIQVLGVGASLFSLLAAAAAGPLDPPPGPVAPTHKTLTEVEPRTPISAEATPGDADSVYRIAAAGSYYLAGPALGAAGKRTIEIAASGVTLDLNGFTVFGHEAGLDAVTVLPGNNFVTVRNGIVTSAAEDGIDAGGSNHARIEGVTATACGGRGIASGIRGVVAGCTARGNAGAGIQASDIGRITDCDALANGGIGIHAADTAIIERCILNNNAGGGISAASQAVVRGNLIDFHNAPGTFSLRITGFNGRIENNTLARGVTGLLVTGANNSIAGNTLSAHTDSYDVAGGNHVSILLTQIPETIDVPATVTVMRTLYGAAGHNGLTIAASEVTVDLNGFALFGVPGALDGVSVVGPVTNVTVRNGALRTWPGDGVDASSAYYCRFDAVTATNNGGQGFRTGFFGRAAGCTAVDNLGYGFEAADLSLVEGCTARGNGTGAAGGGILVASKCIVRDNLFADHLSGRRAIHLTGSRSRVDGNTITNASTGIEVGGSLNIVIRNTLGGAATPIAGAGGQIGPVVNVAGATNPFSNLSF